jgi:hypothetical protein
MQWRKDKRPDRDGVAADIAKEVAAEIEAQYDEIRAAAIRSSGA